MKTALTYVFVIVGCLWFGGLVGHEIGYSGRAKMVEQRDRLLKLTQEYADLQTKTEGELARCQEADGVLRALGTACCDAAEKALEERDACRKGKK